MKYIIFKKSEYVEKVLILDKISTNVKVAQNFIYVDEIMLEQKLINILEKVLNNPESNISEDEALLLVSVKDSDLIELLSWASRIKEKHNDTGLYTCTIINAKSGKCSEDCAFCSQSLHFNTDIQTYPLLTVSEMLERALTMAEAGSTYFSFVTSGYDVSDDDIDKICMVARTLKEKTSLKLCASLGMLTKEKGEKLYKSGVERYHHNLETSRSYFNEICTTHDYDENFKTLKAARDAGMELCCGGILGMGESWEQRIELAFALRELDVDTIPLNFLNPIPGTKLEKQTLLTPVEAIKCIILFRVINPSKSIGICGGREQVMGDFQPWAFLAGANGVMIGNYLTTKGRDLDKDLNMLKELKKLYRSS